MFDFLRNVVLHLCLFRLGRTLRDFTPLLRHFDSIGCCLGCSCRFSWCSLLLHLCLKLLRWALSSINRSGVPPSSPHSHAAEFFNLHTKQRRYQQLKKLREFIQAYLVDIKPAILSANNY